MLLTLDSSLAAGYKSLSQVARRVTEYWGLHNLCCSACDSDRLTQSPNNTRAVDFVCPVCGQPYQLKSRSRWSERTVADADHDAMMEAVQSDRTPNLLVLQYSANWQVSNLLLVPSFFFSPSAIQKRKPLGPNARRAGWVGCNILLSAIAPEGKLRLVSDGVLTDATAVRQQYQQLRPLSGVEVTSRGWTLDVFNVISQLGDRSFELDEVYGFAPHLAALHPENQHVKAKIRQQLQVLRDLGLLRFLTRGKYVLLSKPSA